MIQTTKNVISAALDDIRARDVRLIDEASRLAGKPIDIHLWTDGTVTRATGKPPKFPFAERRYVVQSLKFTRHVVPWNEPQIAQPEISAAALETFPDPPACPDDPPSTKKKVVVTGCFDWLHSGHVRFFEEVSGLGDLYVVVGHDANITLLKGHAPMFDQRIRCYVVNAFRFVKLAVLSTGTGWMDAEPEFARIKPDIYAVNEDGDRPEKRAFCERIGIEYRVLKRTPKAGLPRRESSQLRGF
ncbi:MAG: adenylyltransferase/cytidyltransferase family protein [Anaerolineae bacterium]|nr:adenylyltransferase/cytidyltransferase family protein [Phycisphaerae bacterium]